MAHAPWVNLTDEGEVHVRRLVVVSSVLLVVLSSGCASVATSSRNPPATPAVDPQEFHEFLARVDSAQLELQNGKAEAFKALWSRADDITLSGGFGGTIETGWAQIGRRLDWVATQYSNGTHTHEEVTHGISGDLGYVVQLEHIQFVAPGQTTQSIRDYRVTMVFRKEAEGWRIIHRQADSHMTKVGTTQ
jgi:ketosteroid isomerase-like protein